MIPLPSTIPVFLTWSIAILLAFIIGEYGFKWIKLPRISTYAIMGFILGHSQSGFLPKTHSDTVLLLINIAFGLILFEAGYRINMRWLRKNLWIGITSIAEATLTFIAVYILLLCFNMQTSTALLLSALSMATSPATVVRVLHEQGSSGQVTERVLLLSTLNCILAVFCFKVIVAFMILKTSGSIWQASYVSLFALVLSMALGGLLGIVIAALVRSTKTTTHNMVFFAISIIFLVTLTHSLNLSPIMATLTFGLVSRHRRIILNSSQRGFGTLGDLLSVLLFVFIATTLKWPHIIEGVGLGIALIVVRQLSKILGISIFAHVSGISWQKGLLVGFAMAPISAFVILLLEQTHYLGINLVDKFSCLAVAVLILEIIGPIMIQTAVKLSHEVPDTKEY